MPQGWGRGQIIIHKKWDQEICNNYRGITLIITAYKIIATHPKNSSERDRK